MTQQASTLNDDEYQHSRTVTQGWRAIATRCLDQHARITIINADSMTHDIPMRRLGVVRVVEGIASEQFEAIALPSTRTVPTRC
jgi:hypothetical protein